jgi:hypothetical protein
MLVLQSAKLSPSVKGLKPIDQRLIEYYKLRLSGSIRRTLLYSYSLVRGKVYNMQREHLVSQFWREQKISRQNLWDAQIVHI